MIRRIAYLWLWMVIFVFAIPGGIIFLEWAYETQGLHPMVGALLSLLCAGVVATIIDLVGEGLDERFR